MRNGGVNRHSLSESFRTVSGCSYLSPSFSSSSSESSSPWLPTYRFLTTRWPCLSRPKRYLRVP